MNKIKNVLMVAGVTLLGACVPNPVGPPGPGLPLNNQTSYSGIVEASSIDVLFGPTSASQILTNGPRFGGPIAMSWGGTSSTVTPASAPAQAPAAITLNPWLISGPAYANGIGGPLGDFQNDYYIRWKGTKGPDPSLDYSSMTMYFIGNQINFDLEQYYYRGFVFYARGHGNFYVAMAAKETGDPYTTFNFYTKGFGSELTGDDQWHQITVLFSDMQQLYGQSVDFVNVRKKAYGLQFNQEVPLTSNFQLDVDYVRFF